MRSWSRTRFGVDAIDISAACFCVLVAPGILWISCCSCAGFAAAAAAATGVGWCGVATVVGFSPGFSGLLRRFGCSDTHRLLVAAAAAAAAVRSDRQRDQSPGVGYRISISESIPIR